MVFVFGSVCLIEEGDGNWRESSRSNLLLLPMY